MISIKIINDDVHVQYLQDWGHLLKIAGYSWWTGSQSLMAYINGHLCVQWMVSSIGLTSGCADTTILRFHLQMIHFYHCLYLFFFFPVLTKSHIGRGAWRLHTHAGPSLFDKSDSHRNMSNYMWLTQALWQALCASVHMNSFPSNSRLLFLAGYSDEKNR